MIRQNQRFFLAGRILLDWLLVIASYPIAWFLRFGLFVRSGEQPVTYRPQDEWIIAFSVCFLLMLALFNLYNTRRTWKLYDETARIFLAHTTVALLMLLLLYLLKEMELSRWLIFTYFSCSFLFISLSRVIQRILINACARRGLFTTNVVLIGANDLAYEYYIAVQHNRRFGINIHSVLGTGDRPFQDMPLSGHLDDLDRILTDKSDIEQVVIGLKLPEYNLLHQIIDMCEKHGVKSCIIPDYQQYFPAQPYYDEIDNVILIHTRTIPLDSYINKLIKRTLDLLGSIVLLVTCLPLFLIIALLIRLTSKGPVIFRQKRVGYNKQAFIMYKFRTMIMQDPEKEREKWSHKKDARVTRIGRFLRKTSLDETPQFFNVFLGNMSLVGPRPERRQFVEQFSEQIPKYNLKHRVKPGITGLAQVNGCRGDSSLTRRIRYDLYYVEKWSLQMDLYILVRTLLYGFLNRNE